MNRSRIALLSVILFVAPYTIASETSIDTTNNTNPATNTNNTGTETNTNNTGTTNNIIDQSTEQKPASDTTGNQPDQQSIDKKLSAEEKKIKDETSSILAKLGGFAAVPFVFANNITGKVADKTINKVVSMITATKYLKDTRLNNPIYISMFGKAVITSGAVLLAYKLYTMYNAQNEDNDDEIIFDSEEYDDNN